MSTFVPSFVISIEDIVDAVIFVSSSWESSESVSYTHLDVYKRQIFKKLTISLVGFFDVFIGYFIITLIVLLKLSTINVGGFL